MNLFSYLNLKKVKYQNGNGEEVRIQCPECKRKGSTYKDYKLYYNKAKNLGNCKRCGWAGGFKSFAKLLGGGQLTSGPAPSLKDLKRETKRKDKLNQRDTESVLPTYLKPAWSRKRARRYLQSRNLSRREAERYGFMYCPRGYFKYRIIVPVFDERGRYRTFVARYIGNRNDSSTKKYLYPEGCHTSRLLYGLHSNKKAKRRQFAILTEGVWDAIHCAPFGLCCFGINVSDFQVRLLREAGIRKVILCFDHDKKRSVRKNVKEALQRAQKKIRKYMQCEILWLPEKGTDPVDYPLEILLKRSKKLLE